MCAALDSTRERTHLSLFIYSLFNNPFLPRMRLSFCFSFFRKRLSIQTTSLIQLKFILHYRRMTCKDFIIEESGGMEYERKAYPRDNPFGAGKAGPQHGQARDRKSTRLNSSHVSISYAVFCLKKKKRPTMTVLPAKTT